MKNKILLPVTFLVSFFSFSQNWGLDQDFNAVGYNATNMIVNGDDYAECLTIQADGKILVGGYGLRIARYNTDGTLDTSFNSVGYTPPYGTNVSLNYIKQIIITPTNKILAIGAIYTNQWFLYLAQYNTNGTLDTSFGTNGRKNIDLGPSVTMTVGNAIYTSDNMILIAANSFFSDGDFKIVKCNKFGILESTFGGTGIVTLDGISNDIEGRIALRSDGKILLSGNSNASPAQNTLKQHVLMLVNSDGNLESSFGTNGKIFTNFWSNNSQEIRSMALLSDDSILISGHYYTNNTTQNDGFVSKFNSNGTLDTTFGVNGVRVISFSDSVGSLQMNDYINKMTTQTDGKIVIVGFTNGFNVNNKFCIARLNAVGTIDISFGVNGQIVLPIFGFDDVITDVKIQSDGKVVVSGLTKINSLDRSYVVARLTPNSTLSSSEINSNNNAIKLYPNPAKDKITITGMDLQFSNRKCNAILMSVDGKEIKSLNFTTSNDSFDFYLNEVSSGVYILKISDGNKKIIRKFIKE
jgi:uncharacterized delta-60 repeat protein